MDNHGSVVFLVAAQAKGGPGVRAITVSIDTLKANLAQATASLASALDDVVEVGRFELQEVEIGVEVGAEGGIEFIGTATASGKAAITLTFRPNAAKKTG
jgi:hypothetical protein